MTRILIIQGHPDPDPAHFGHALASAYAEGARAAGHTVETVTVATVDFPLLRTKADWEHGALPPALAPVQQAIVGAEHLVFFFPLWLGGMPALLKGLLEQVARPGYAIARDASITSRQPLGVPRPGRAGAGARHPALHRHQAGARDARRFGRGRRCGTPTLACQDGAAGPGRRMMKPSRTAQEVRP